MSETSPGLAVAWRIAATEAGALGYPRIECAHLLMGILSLDKATARVMKDLGLDEGQMDRVASEQAAVLELFGSTGVSPRALRRDLRSRLKRKPQPPKGVMSRSTAAKAVFARAETLAAGRALNSLHLLSVLLRDPDPVISSLLVAHGLGPDVADRAQAAAAKAIKRVAIRREPTTAKSRRPEAPPSPGASESVLGRFGRDITAQARAGEIGPVIGRDEEIHAVLQTLSRPSRNTPLLVGEAGVGKTAIVEGVALRGALGKDAPVLAGKRIIELNVDSLLAGVEPRGGYAQRMKDLLDELRASGDVILFIDGIHTVVGADRAGSIPDAASSLKQALARGEIRVIGATSTLEFRQNIEKDEALYRRFEKIDVVEPAANEALLILRGLKGRFEQRHGVEIADTAFEAAVSLSVRFDPEHRLPGKAVDLIDRAAARGESTRTQPGARVRRTKVSQGRPVDGRAVAEVLAEKKGLPVEILTDGGGEGARLLKLEAHLKSKLIGQDEAVATVAARIRLAHAGLSERRGPIATFIFLGPEGVGKTEMARTLAKFLFGGNLVHFHGQLPEQLRARPDSVLLLDEIEKAHVKVIDRLFEFLDTAEARNTIVIMTSHLGNREVPAIAGRVDDIVTFRPLDEADVRRIARPLLAALITNVRKTHGVLLRFEPEAEALVVRSGFDAKNGVRELKPAIERLVAMPLATLAVSGKLAQHPAWKAVRDDGGLCFLPE